MLYAYIGALIGPGILLAFGDVALGRCDPRHTAIRLELGSVGLSKWFWMGLIAVGLSAS
jgi:hypothetical protein